MTETRIPSIRQMAARSLSGHLKILRALDRDQDVAGPTARDSEIRGLRICFATLARWGCVETITHDDRRGAERYERRLTATGRELLQALNKKERPR